MSARLVVRMVAPVVGVSIILMGVGVIAAWYVHRLQKNATDVLAINVGSMRAAEELEIGMREIRTQLNQFLLTGNRAPLENIPALRKDAERWLQSAERLATTDHEQQLMRQVRRGYVHFFDEFDRIVQSGPDEGTREEVAALVHDVLTKEILAPAHEYLDFNEQVIARSSQQSQKVADRMVFALLLLGTCGPVAGLLTGFAIARGISRSIVQLSVPVHDAAGKLNEVVGPITISGNRGLADLDAGLRRLATEITTVVDQLQQSQREVLRAEQLAAIGQLAAGVAHELRNPLMSMKLLVQSAAESNQGARLEGRDLVVLGDAIGRVERSVKTFLDFARPPALEKRPFELREIVDDTIQLVSGRAESQSVSIECVACGNSMRVMADPGQMRQVLLNLLINALDAMPQGGTLRVELAELDELEGDWGDIDSVCDGTLAQCDGWLQIRVSDTGVGLPADLGARIFDPFVTTKETGIGLGLPICKRIVEAHGGRLATANRLEGGATFTVSLPRMRYDSISLSSAEVQDSRVAVPPNRTEDV